LKIFNARELAKGSLEGQQRAQTEDACAGPAGYPSHVHLM
jgi:hypothetical protein